MFHLVYSEPAFHDLKRLQGSVRLRITEKLSFFARQTHLEPFAKALEGEKGVFRFRVGDYRILFRVESTGEIRILKILRVKHRKDVYDL